MELGKQKGRHKMADYNKVILIGRMTRDIEVRYTPSGAAVGDLSLAVNEKRKDGEDIVSFVDVTAWGRTAEVIAEYAGKGKEILIEGRIRQERWEKDGQARSKLKVICERMQLLGGSPQSNDGEQATEDNAPF